MVVLTFAVLPFVIYFGFFGVGLLDEVVFETFLIEKAIPDRAYDFLNTMYQPLDPILEWLGL